MGSLILSRSFNVEKWQGEDDDDDTRKADTRSHDEMDIDEVPSPANDDGEPSQDSHEDETYNNDDDDAEDSSDVAMVPMADMLNARYGSENVRLSPFSLADAHWNSCQG